VNAGDDYSQHAHDGGKTGGVAQSKDGPAAAGGGAAADDSGAAATQSARAKTKRGLRERMKRAPWWSNLIGVFALLLASAATVLLVLDQANIAIVGYVLSIAGVVIGAVPLFRG
jgi:hypothetical protein